MRLLLSGAFIAALLVAMGCIGPENGINGIPGNGIIGENDTIRNETDTPVDDELIVEGPCTGPMRAEVDLCLSTLSESDDGPSYCSLIHNSTLRDTCHYNRMECAEISDSLMRKECMLKEGLIACESSHSPSLCKALLTKSPTHCGTNTECLLQYAFSAKSEEACALISDETGRVGCIASVRNEYNECYRQLQFEANQKECIKLYARITGIDGNICERISISEYRDDCYRGVAEASGDPSNCFKLTIYGKKRDCLYAVAVKTGNHTICDYNEYRDDVGFCKARVGAINNLPSVCQDIGDAKYVWGCFADSIVKGKMTEDECAKIDRSRFPDWSRICYESI